MNIAEGGPILISTPQHGSIEVIIESNKPKEAKTRESAPKERYASRTGFVVARKGVQEKIKPRKGVQEEVSMKSINQNVDLERENVSFNQTSFENMKFITDNNPMIEKVHIESKIFNISNLKLNATDLPFDDSLNRNINSNASLILANGTTSNSTITNNTTMPKAFLHIKKHIPKPKPTVTTIDEPEINESIPLSRMKNPSLGMPRKIDYIVPVIITIVALPILGAVIFVLYRRGRDCWDKRHYRRMDFLIDGMYND